MAPLQKFPQVPISNGASTAAEEEKISAEDIKTAAELITFFPMYRSHVDFVMFLELHVS